MLSAKAKLTDPDDHLNGMDATFDWKRLASGQRRAGNTEVGSGSATSGWLMERG